MPTIARTLLAVSSSALLSIVVLTVLVLPASASTTNPTFVVMNASEQLPDGVWFRSSPNVYDTDHVTGHGVYMNDIVQLSCFVWGDSVGPSANLLWYYAHNLTRPIVPGTNQPNEGYLSAHYINDGLAANQVDDGVPECGVGDQPGSVYYSPFTDPSQPTWAMASTTLTFDQWSVSSGVEEWLSSKLPQVFKPACDSSKAYLPSTDSLGRTIRQASAWSIGRVGLLYALSKASDDQLRALDQIIFYDPGSYKELTQSCDNQIGASQILAHVLSVNPNVHILILAGMVTADYDHPDNNGYAHAGIQDVYFPAIRDNSDWSSRTLVCNYDSLDHQTVYEDFNYLMSQSGAITSCPIDPVNGFSASASWHP